MQQASPRAFYIESGRAPVDAIARRGGRDVDLVARWLHGRPATTQRVYRSDVDRLLAFTGRPLAELTEPDLQAFADSLAQLAPATQARVLSAVRSLLAYGYRKRVLADDVGADLRLPRQRDQLAERILGEDQVQRLIALEPDRRNRAMLRLAYAAGLRVSELVALRWRDLVDRGDAGQVTVFGKGGKTRTVLLSAPTWRELVALRGEAGPNAAVFPSRQGHGPLDPSQARRIVAAAAARAAIAAKVSPHWLRHAHASHALERSCPIHLVQATLGHASVATTGRYLHARPTDSSARYLAV